MVVDIVTPSPEKPLEFTGERYTSAASGEIKHEHYHRYFFSLQFCCERVVLDIASGEGYGSALLGIVAQQVIGFDISAEAVNHAMRNYSAARVSFAVGDCTSIPLPDSSVDVVVSFETLEHVGDQKKFFCEIKRILRPHGILVISTPNVEVYKEVATKPNPFHVKELGTAEFRAILSENFANYRLFGQRSVVGSAIMPDSAILNEADRQQTFKAADGCVYTAEPGIGPPTYLIAVASADALPAIQHGLLDDRPFLMNLYELLQERAAAILKVEHEIRVAATIRDGLEQQIRDRDSALTEVGGQASKLRRELQSVNDQLARVRRGRLPLDHELAQLRRERRSLDDELAQLRQERRSLDDELAQLRQERRSLDDELAQTRALVASIYKSGSWRVTGPLRFLRRIAEALRRRGVRLVSRLGKGWLFGPPMAIKSTAAPPPAGSTERETELQVLGRSGLFDEQFYCNANPDVAVAKVSALEHFVYRGAFEGRRPNPLFDSAYYLSTYPDVAKAGVNPALHYFLSGALEGRDPSTDFDTSFYLEANPDVAKSGINPLVHFLRFGANEGRLPLPPQSLEIDPQRVRRLAAARHRQEKLDYRPLLSVLMPTYNTPPVYLEAAVRSVTAQAYTNWELRIVDDGSSSTATLEALERIRSWDERIFVVRNAQNRGISAATNDALRDARGEYIAMLDHDDELTFDALYEVVLALNADRTTDVVYTDQDYVSPEGKPAGHLFKPDWSPALFRGVMYVGHLLTVRRNLALDSDGFDAAFDLVQDFEFMLRLSERTRKIRHVPKALYHWRRIPVSVAGGGKADGKIEQLQAAAVQAHLERLGLDGCARPNPRHRRRVVIEGGRHPQNTTFDVIVHGRAVSKTAAMAAASSLARMAHRVARVVVPTAWSELGIASEAKADLSFYDGDRDLSEGERLSRLLIECSGEFVLAMSAEVVIDTDDWTKSLLLAAQEPDVAAVCPAVLSADGVIAHAGLVVGRDAKARAAMHGFEPESDGYAGSLSCAREISAAWAEMVLLRRSLLASLLTPNPVYVTADFLVADLTLRATTSGLRAVCVPYVRARRLATSEADADHHLDTLLFQDIWGGNAVGDPFYNPNFLNVCGDYT